MQKSSKEEVKITARYLALRFISSPSQRKRFLRDISIRKMGAPEIFYIVQNIAHALLAIFEGVAAAYLYDLLKKKRNKELQTVLNNVYDKDIEKKVTIYKKKVIKLKQYIDEYPTTNTFKNRIIIKTHEEIILKLEDKSKSIQLMNRHLNDYSKLEKKGVDQYVNKYR